MKAAVALGMLAAAVAATPAIAGDAVVKASCSQDGRVVYREEIPAGAASERRILIASMHPKALCVFLEPRDPSVPAAEATASGAVGQVSEEDDASLAAALAVIASGKPGDAYPDGISDFVKGSAGESAPAAKPVRKAAGDAHFLNLAIGVYENVPLADVMAHWKEMQEGSKVLSRMTPTVNSSGDVTMVSVEGVPDELAAQLCDEAAVKGPGCLAVY